MNDCSVAAELIAKLPDTQAIVADKGYDSKCIREQIVKKGTRAVIPGKCNSVKAISESKHPHQAGRIRMSHLGKSGLRSNLVSISRMAFLDRETPFW